MDIWNIFTIAILVAAVVLPLYRNRRHATTNRLRSQPRPGETEMTELMGPRRPREVWDVDRDFNPSAPGSAAYHARESFRSMSEDS